MKIFTHNFNPESNSGPNKFTRTLFSNLVKEKDVSLSAQEDADVEFCLIQQQVHKVKPMLLRLDGIWFNSDQDFKQQNAPIHFAYQNADAVVFQSQFNKRLTEAWFGEHKNSHVIHNAADDKLILAANKHFWNDKFDGSETEVWCCASSWRPHKRLNDNIAYFLEFAPPDAQLAIAGGLGMDEVKEIISLDNRIHVLGDLDYMSLLSLYKRSTKFIHLAYLDHCPNVVVDAQASGCHIICSSTGGTSEVVSDGTVIVEDEWDFKPTPLYKPPKIDFLKSVKVKRYDKKKEIKNCAQKYYNIMQDIS